MTHADLVSDLDKKYRNEPVECPNEGRPAILQQSKVTRTEHGSLQVHKSATFIVCGVCGYQQPIGRI
jgi:hypothetical protein